MRTSRSTAPFQKTAACPASATLLSFRVNSLSAEAAGLVKDHLKVCDFCSAELPLLAHHVPVSGAYAVPEIPDGLRILAESILSRK